MNNDANMGKVVGVCFMILWCSVAFGMGITALQWGAPTIFALVPFGMGIFGIVMCLGIARSQSIPESASRIRRDQFTTYSGDSMSAAHVPTSRQERLVYQVPSRCPSCGASINTETVDWVGPLQVKCPYCNSTVDAELRTL